MMSGIICCACSTSHFSSTVCSAAMAKRFQQDSGEKRVTAKSKPMMNLIARAPSNVSSSTSVSPRKRSYENKNPWSTIAEKEEGSGRPDISIDRKKAFDHYYHEQFMERFPSTNHSKWDDVHAWSSQEWKSEVTAHDRSGQPDKISWSMVQQVRPHHEDDLLDGNAQSVRYGETIMMDRGNLIALTTKKVQNRKFSSWEVTQQNL